MQRFIIPGFVLLGVALVILGSVWNCLNPPSNYWSDAQAKELTDAQIALHSQSHEHGPTGKNSDAPTYTAAKQRYGKIKAELDSARNARSRTANIFIGAGLASVISAAVLHYRSHLQTG